MFDLNGSYTHNVDAKGRVSLPAKFRKKLPEELVVTPNLSNECLLVFDEESHNDWVASFFNKDGGFDALNPAHDKLRRKLKSRAKNVSQDSAGRISLPADYRDAVGIDKEVLIIGNTGYFEIWDAKSGEDELDEIDLMSYLRS